MGYKNFFRWLELAYKIDINKELRNALTEYFGENSNIYAEQDLYEYPQKLIQIYKDKYINNNYYKYRKYL